MLLIYFLFYLFRLSFHVCDYNFYLECSVDLPVFIGHEENWGWCWEFGVKILSIGIRCPHHLQVMGSMAFSREEWAPLKDRGLRECWGAKHASEPTQLTPSYISRFHSSPVWTRCLEESVFPKWHISLLPPFCCWRLVNALAVGCKLIWWCQCSKDLHLWGRWWQNWVWGDFGLQCSLNRGLRGPHKNWGWGGLSSADCSWDEGAGPFCPCSDQMWVQLALGMRCSSGQFLESTDYWGRVL
jgi:hypothetical protein